ncbi:MAG: hypothetical protein K8H88_14495 [Sandaracinaceae bacterium]|nr:hypothetical protein [Sandaracinaceae bacterium]
MRHSYAIIFAFVLFACGSSHTASDAGADGGVTDCDPRHPLCSALPPACPPGFAASVEGTCWGPCVPNLECGPITCDPAMSGQCPEGWGCVTDPNPRCAPPR